jgi:predicted ArsR family transcriptional regulator
MKRVQSTSLDALDAAQDSSSAVEAAIMFSLRGGDMTCTELARNTGIVIDTVRPAVTHLKDVGLVEATDGRRPTRFGKPSIVWALARPRPPLEQLALPL